MKDDVVLNVKKIISHAFAKHMVMIKYVFFLWHVGYTLSSSAFELSTVRVVTEDRLRYCMDTFFSPVSFRAVAQQAGTEAGGLGDNQKT